MHRALGSISTIVREGGRRKPSYPFNHRITLTVQTQPSSISIFSFKVFLRGNLANSLRLPEETQFRLQISITHIAKPSLLSWCQKLMINTNNHSKTSDSQQIVLVVGVFNVERKTVQFELLKYIFFLLYCSCDVPSSQSKAD